MIEHPPLFLLFEVTCPYIVTNFTVSSVTLEPDDVYFKPKVDWQSASNGKYTA
jgi:hypothetical protein